MKNNVIFLSALTAGCFLAFAFNQSFAAEQHPNFPKGGKGTCSSCSKKIESVSEKGNGSASVATKKLKMNSSEKFQGTVSSVTQDKYPDGTRVVRIVLDTNEGQKSILVGPAGYIEQSKVKLQVGDKVTVTGYIISANGEEVITAKEVNKSGNVLILLDDQRQPLWKNGNGK